MKLLRGVALQRLDDRTNKEISRALAEQGINLTPEYIGKLIAAEMRKLKRKRNISVRMFHGEQAETGESSGTIKG